MQEDMETARMHNEDLRQHLLNIGARVDAALLTNVRRRMLPGTKVRIKKEWALPLGISSKDVRNTMILREQIAQHCWNAECATGLHQGTMFWCPLPECAFEFA